MRHAVGLQIPGRLKSQVPVRIGISERNNSPVWSRTGPSLNVEPGLEPAAHPGWPD